MVGRGSPAQVARDVGLLRERIRDELRDAILRGELVAGERLSTTVLASRFGVSAMPVREALRLLQESGLVEVSARRWTRVASPDPELADEIYPLLIVLERYAVATVAWASVAVIERATRANAELREAADKNDALLCLRADMRFHRAVVEASRNPTLITILDELKGRIQLLESAYYRVENANVSANQHDRVLAALVEGDFQAAGDALASNWEHGLRRLRARLSTVAGTRPSDDGAQG